MVRKVCPVCEQTMALSHYCKNCRCFVKTPYIRDITYYLNESHPEGEENCDYHDKTRERKGAPVSVSTDTRPKGKAPIWFPSSKGQKKNIKADKKRAVYAILGIMVLIQIIGAIKSLVYEFAVPSYDGGSDFQLLTDEEVKQEGVPCSSNGHYSIKGAVMADEMEEIIAAAGYEIESTEISSWNYAETGEFSWTDYDTTAAYEIISDDKGQEGMYLEVTVNYDTATGQLHGVTFYMSEIGPAGAMAQRVLEFLQEQGEIMADKEYGVLVRDELVRFSDSEEEEEDQGGNWMEIPGEEGQTEIYFHETDGGFYVKIWKMG